MASLRDCPVCGRPDPMQSVERAAIPVFQNVTYDSAETAAAAPRGRFVMATCRSCGFSYNGAFEAARVVYDENYDNHVASDAFRDYYRDQARMLIDRFGIAEGCVFDVGCGKGEFLEVLHGLEPCVRAVGIDPSCTPRDEGNFRLIQSHFSASLFTGDARLVLLRHVLEHLDQPVEFLKQLNAAMPDVPLYVEVPDLDWILDNQAFWDFCYEHCNYFTQDSLARACREAGFTVEEQQRSFGGQYQWILCRPRGDGADGEVDPSDALAKVGTYVGREADKIAALTEMARGRGGVAIWGMATKGVMLSNILPEGLVAGGVDMNLAKQGRFVAGSGVEIHSPDWLLTRPADSAVLVMNPNYADEIAETARAIGAEVVLQSI